MKFSVIIPVYNRPDEVDELLQSLKAQDFKDFEMVIVEDGSSLPCKDVIDKYISDLNIRYFFKENSGPGLSRNFGMEKAEGQYMVFFDSDCVIPSNYFSAVNASLEQKHLDAYGGPDAAHESFTNIQKAINYAMTSFFTTGGIRGRKKQLDKFQPRSFNMGFTKEVYNKVGGFSTLHPGEDPDLSYRIMAAGFRTGLIPEAYVYHKRRIDFGKFAKQVYKFGVVRSVLIKWHKGTFKFVYALPSLFLLGTIAILLGAIFINKIFIYPLLLFALLVFVDSLMQTKNLGIALLSIYASFIQLLAYGVGFIKGVWKILILKKDERKSLPGFFFKDSQVAQ
ncbi:MAG: glycosyltransferase [Bacteroidia bacterium]|nr:glycosyltransferase [Bacteroidia bacterium]